jgi:hypothetical protein
LRERAFCPGNRGVSTAGRAANHPLENAKSQVFIAQRLSDFEEELAALSSDQIQIKALVDEMRRHLEDKRDKSFQLQWTLYLANTQPVRGQVPLSEVFELSGVSLEGHSG